MARMPQSVQHRLRQRSASGSLIRRAPANSSHEAGRPVVKVKGVAVQNAGRINLDRKDLMFLLWNDDPNRLRRRCASVARPGRSASLKFPIGLLSAHSALPA